MLTIVNSKICLVQNLKFMMKKKVLFYERMMIEPEDVSNLSRLDVNESLLLVKLEFDIRKMNNKKLIRISGSTRFTCFLKSCPFISRYNI